MINLKLTVQLIITFGTCVSCSEYCGICPNHTLCVYGVGPSTNCREYDSSVQLSRDDIVTLLMRINEQRNFVAFGKSNNMPQAANMKKINWSEDLATFAQRWVDQCDPFVRPDRHDQCRDLKGVKVSQSIVTVFGFAPGINIKSYVDIWYMQRLQYLGNIFLYDEFRNQKTNHFTQLIWAETESVGCGKARFYLASQNATVERLVCNFAPAGNIHGKPVYILGIPATQCKDNYVADIEYTGLCTTKLRVNENERKVTPKKPSRTSLLRIVNLLNSSVKQDIDPIKNYPKQMNTKPEDGDRNQKLRHVFNSSLENRSPYEAPTPEHWKFLNDTKKLNQHLHDRGHAKVYHGHNFMEYVPAVLTTKKFSQLESTTTKQSISKFRRVNQGKVCTRKTPTSGCDVRLPCVTNKCTRGLRSDCMNTPPCFISPSNEQLFARSLCPCSSQSPNKPTCNNCCNLLRYRPTPFSYPCTNKVHINTASSCCPKFTRLDDIIHGGHNGEINNREPHYYDLFPNVAMRSGGDLTEENVSEMPPILNKMATQKTNIFTEENNDRIVKNVYREHSMNNDYIYDVFDTIDRIKRDTDEEDKPFWKVNDHSSPIPLQLRALRYTTLRSKNKNTGRSTSRLSKPEGIHTQSLDNGEDYNRNHDNKERYLSFDELMSLRKNNMGDHFRRNNKKKNPPSTKMVLRAETTKAATTVATTTNAATPPANYTINTPFLRKKYCTRKLTCTWTAFTITGSDGKVIDGGGGVPQGIPGQGSKTPPGYVEGCTRTSTCTRDYMNRNKISTTPKTTIDDSETVPDEDYCERRELEVRPEPDDDTELNEKIKRHISKKKFVSDKRLTARKEQQSEANTMRKLDFNLTRSIYNKNLKSRKRRELNMLSYPDLDIEKKIDLKNSEMSYGDLYYLVLTKLIRAWNSTDHSQNHKKNKCLCNYGFKTYECKGILGISILVIINQFLTLL